MNSVTLATLPAVTCEKLDRTQIDSRLAGCACLPSLSTIDSALRELLGADQRYTSQIAEIIRRDPSLTSRLLRLVNSVYYGMTKPVRNIEEAVFFTWGSGKSASWRWSPPLSRIFKSWQGAALFPGANSGGIALPPP